MEQKSFVRVLFLILLISCHFIGCSLIQPRLAGPRRETRDQNLVPPNTNEAGPRKRLGVLPFLDQDPRPESLRQQSQIRLIEELNKQGQLLVFLMNPSELSSCQLANQEYDLKNCSRDSQKLGYQALLEGKILDFKVKRSAETVGVVRKLKTQFEAVLRIRVFSVRGQKEIFNTIKTVNYSLGDLRVGERVTADQFIETNPELVEQVIVEGFLEFIPQIQKPLAKMNWEGRIATIQGDRLYLNVGSLSGVQVGDILRVYEEGVDIYDPEMGTSIGRAPGRVKGTLEIVGFFGHDGSVAIIHSGGGFRENDRLEIY
jgi:hypothetical protein